MGLAQLDVAVAEDGAHQQDADIAAIGERASRLGVEIADIVGIIEDMGRLGQGQLRTLTGVVREAEATGKTNARLAASMEETRASATEARATLSASADTVAHTLDGAVRNLQTLSEDVIGFGASLERVTATIRLVREASASINEIARETQLVALNASIEAARLGDAGKGFAVIGNAVKALADQIGSAAKQNETSLAALQGTLAELNQTSKDSAATAEAAIEASEEASEATRTIQSLVASVEQLADRIEAMADPVQQNIAASDQVRTHLGELAAMARDSDAKLTVAGRRSQAILDISEDFILYIAGTGIRTPDTPLIEICRHKAGEIAALFEAAVDEGSISLAELFDEDYRPIPGTDPAQVMARFTAFTDRVLPPVQEPVLAMDPRIVFCAALDRNGYLPTHNLVYSRPQGDDPVWNAANCRNRRIFSDRTGLGAGRNTRPFLLQTYRRDMGGGNFALMKDLSAPIAVKGRHWGGLRIGYKV